MSLVQLADIVYFNLEQLFLLVNRSFIGLYFLNINKGTGSYPWVPPGRHLNILLVPNRNPFRGPWSFRASSIYAEHVGTCLQEGRRWGDITYL